MTMEDRAVKEMDALKAENAYLKKTNLCIAKQSINGKIDLVWVMREELKVLSVIYSEGGLNKFKLALYNSLKKEFANGSESCERYLLSRIKILESQK